MAEGTWPDTQDDKFVEFDPGTASAVRLLCSTEAGDRGPWTSANLISLYGTLESGGGGGGTGAWGPLIDFPLVPVAAAALPDNTV